MYLCLWEAETINQAPHVKLMVDSCEQTIVYFSHSNIVTYLWTCICPHDTRKSSIYSVVLLCWIKLNISLNGMLQRAQSKSCVCEWYICVYIYLTIYLSIYIYMSVCVY